MFTKWLTGNSSSLHREFRLVIAFLLCLALLLSSAGCSLLPKEQQEEALPTIMPPKISKKPEYTVKTETLETKVQAVGKLMSLEEETLYYTGDVNSAGSGDKRVKDVYVNVGDRVEQGQLICELDVSDLERNLRSQELQFRSQELAMIKVLRNSDDLSPEELEQKKIDFELERSKLQDMRDAIAKSKIVAPFAGTVVSMSVHKGDTVQSYDPISVISDLSKLTVAAKIGSDDVQKIAVGMKADVNINAAGQFTGTVKQLPIKQDSNQNNRRYDQFGRPIQQTDSIENYLVIQLDSFPEGLNRGTPLSVTIVTDRKENAVTIPLAALRTHAGRNYVQVVDADGGKQEIDVEVGQRTSTVVEIVKGLKPGQKVVGR